MISDILNKKKKKKILFLQKKGKVHLALDFYLLLYNVNFPSVYQCSSVYSVCLHVGIIGIFVLIRKSNFLYIGDNNSINEQF